MIAGDDHSHKALEGRLGQVLIKKNPDPNPAQPADIIKSFERKQKGEIPAVEFRQMVRSWGVKADSKELDALFRRLDADGGGSLDATELTLALKMMLEAVTDANLDDHRMRDRLERLKTLQAQLHVVHEATRQAEDALAKAAEAAKSNSFDRKELQELHGRATELKHLAVNAQLETNDMLRELAESDEASAKAAEKAMAEGTEAFAAAKARASRTEEAEKKEAAQRRARLAENQQNILGIATSSELG